MICTDLSVSNQKEVHEINKKEGTSQPPLPPTQKGMCIYIYIYMLTFLCIHTCMYTININSKKHENSKIRNHNNRANNIKKQCPPICLPFPPQTPASCAVFPQAQPPTPIARSRFEAWTLTRMCLRWRKLVQLVYGAGWPEARFSDVLFSVPVCCGVA